MNGESPLKRREEINSTFIKPPHRKKINQNGTMTDKAKMRRTNSNRRDGESPARINSKTNLSLLLKK